jgi:hypothetical protein
MRSAAPARSDPVWKALLRDVKWIFWIITFFVLVARLFSVIPTGRQRPDDPEPISRFGVAR